MSKERKQYQLWVWYEVQPAENPQQDYHLALESDDPAEIYMAQARLDKNDERFITQLATIRVQVI